MLRISLEARTQTFAARRGFGQRLDFAKHARDKNCCDNAATALRGRSTLSAQLCSCACNQIATAYGIACSHKEKGKSS